MLRVVLDTNVLVSAIISNGKSRELLTRGIKNQFSIITSDLIVKELVSVLKRPKFRTNEDEINRIIKALIKSSEIIVVKSKLEAVKQDPKDNIIIETAYDGKADIIVSGDRHLLTLKTFKGIRIMTVEGMLRSLK
jgi:putative PIN family toxin of toxin-antitoxin system